MSDFSQGVWVGVAITLVVTVIGITLLAISVARNKKE